LERENGHRLFDLAEKGLCRPGVTGRRLQSSSAWAKPISPRRAEAQSKGTTKSPGVNTSQALQSTNAFICEFISALTPPNRRWAELQPTTALVEEIAGKGLHRPGDTVSATAMQ
jgi:hypothetical protein